LTFDRDKPPLRRGERFALTDEGAAAARAYLEGVVAARAIGGRRSFEAACEAWAAKYVLDAAHGAILSELLSTPMTARELASQVEGYGATHDEVRKGLDVLRDAKLISPA
jgi:hypothetical protein